MELSVAERLAIVETQVATIKSSQDEMALDVRVIRDHVVGDKAERRLRNHIFAGIAGFFAFLGTVWALVEPFAAKK